MTDRTPWERLDAPAATPSSIAATRGLASSGSSQQQERRRLGRSRSPVLAAFDGGGDVFQRHLRTLLVGSAAILVPLVAVNLWVTIVGFDRFDPDDSLFPSLGSGTGSGIEDVAPFVGATATSLATAIVGFFVASVVLADRLASAAPDTGVSLWRTLGQTVRRLPVLVFTWMLGHWWQPLLVVFLLSVDQDSVGGVAFVVAPVAMLASAATLFTVPALIAERLGPVAALRRAWRLFRRSAGTTLLFIVLSTVLGSLFLFGVATIAPLLEANGFVAFGGAAWIVQGVMVQLGVLFTVPLIASCTAQCYLEVRLDREGLDLVLDADAAFPDDTRTGDPVGDGAPG